MCRFRGNLLKPISFLCTTLIAISTSYPLISAAASYGAEATKSRYETEKARGEVISRFNDADPLRTPLTAFPFKEISERSFAPIRVRREGFVPRLLIMEEYNDNILFESEQQIEDFITVISPGFNFVHRTKRSQIELDYSFESTIYPQNSEFGQAFETQNLLFSGNFQLTKNSLFSLTNTFFSFKDQTNQTIPGVSPRSRVYENYLHAFLNQNLSSEANLTAGYTFVLNAFDDTSLANSRIHDGYFSYARVTTARDVAEFEYRFRQVDFNRQSTEDDETTISLGDGEIHLLALKNTHDFSENWSLVTKVGAALVSEPVSSADVIASVAVTTSLKDSLIEIRYDRDISTTGGFDTLLQSDMLSTSVSSALTNKLYGKLRVNLSQFKQIYNGNLTVEIIEPSFDLEYKWSKNIQFRLSYHYLFQQLNIDNLRTDSNKINLGIVASF